MTRFRRSGKNWEGRTWAVAAPIDSLADDIEAAYPPRHSKDGTVASKGHDTNSPNSDHRPKPISGTGIVRALDFGEHNEEGFGIMDAIRASRDPRLKYGIHEGQMFSSYASGGVPPFTWRPYSGPNQHLDHGHLSTLVSADAQAGSWDIGTGDEDMPITDEEFDKIRAIQREEINLHFGPAWTPTSGPSKGKRFVQALVDSAWNLTSSGRKTLETLDATHDYAKKASEHDGGGGGASDISGTFKGKVS